MDVFTQKESKRLAFDMGAHKAISPENIASYVNEAGVCINKNEAISVFSWERCGDKVVCREFGPDDVMSYMDLESALGRAESKGAMAMRKQFLEGARISLQIMPPLDGVYNEGRGVLMMSEGSKANLYGFRIGEEVFRTGRLDDKLRNLHAEHNINIEQNSSSLRQISLDLSRFDNLSNLSFALPELVGIWHEVESGRAVDRFEKLKETVAPLADKYCSILDEVKSREGLVKIGARMESDLASMGMAVARVSGCGFSNMAMLGGYYEQGLASGLANILTSEVVWKKPEKKMIFREGKWREFVKIEKCGFHWKNGGNCTWEPKDFVEVGSVCPCCKNKFVCA